MWIPSEYKSGYEARYESMSLDPTQTLGWQDGWQAANFELTQSFAGGGGEDSRESQHRHDAWWGCQNIGSDARICGLPFDESRSEAWKVGWIGTDIAIISLQSYVEAGT
jgi:hypothetical protein